MTRTSRKKTTQYTTTTTTSWKDREVPEKSRISPASLRVKDNNTKQPKKSIIPVITIYA